jgi:hypothetical protein|tara:strand:+ start:663 stop:764 length:102 start_codon:yes stop_codon:yes gene_type:complete
MSPIALLVITLLGAGWCLVVLAFRLAEKWDEED